MSKEPIWKSLGLIPASPAMHVLLMLEQLEMSMDAALLRHKELEKRNLLRNKFDDHTWMEQMYYAEVKAMVELMEDLPEDSVLIPLREHWKYVIANSILLVPTEIPAPPANPEDN